MSLTAVQVQKRMVDARAAVTWLQSLVRPSAEAGDPAAAAAAARANKFWRFHQGPEAAEPDKRRTAAKRGPCAPHVPRSFRLRVFPHVRGKLTEARLQEEEVP